MTKKVIGIDATGFGVVKEYLEVGGNVKGIAKVTGLDADMVELIAQTPHYKAFTEIFKNAAKQPEPEESQAVNDDTLKVLQNLTDAIVGMTISWERMEEKLDEVIAAKRPWLGRVGK